MADTYDVTTIPQLGQIKLLSTTLQARLNALETDNTAIRAVAIDGNTLKFFNTTDMTNAATYTVNLPEEMFLDQNKTAFVESFTYSAEKYPNTNDPQLNGKPVMVLAVKGDATIKFSFLNMEKLIDIYTASDTSVTITEDYKVKVNVSAAANNAITLKNDGLHVDVSGKIDKVANATAGNIATLASDGSVADSTIRFATDAEFRAMLDEVLPSPGSES